MISNGIHIESAHMDKIEKEKELLVNIQQTQIINESSNEMKLDELHLTNNPISTTSNPPINIENDEDTKLDSDDHVNSHEYNGSIIFKPSESGLANNLLGLVSAFVIAAMTNKRLFCRTFKQIISFYV